MIGQGSKWTLRQLKEYFQLRNIDYDNLFLEIHKLITLTLLSLVQNVPGGVSCPYTRSNCFELYGFDILIDNVLKPWLLEINGPPQLTIDSDIDVKVKYPLIREMI